MTGVLDGVAPDKYNGIWKIWKLGSLILFGAFVLVIVDVARTLRKIARDIG
jgi:hypothetical protein